jgi:hypothetical protein
MLKGYDVTCGGWMQTQINHHRREVSCRGIQQKNSRLVRPHEGWQGKRIHLSPRMVVRHNGWPHDNIGV